MKSHRHPSPGFRRKRALSILEIVIACAILTAMVIPFADSFSGLRRGLTSMDAHARALMLARAVIDHIHYRLYNEDVRVSNLLDTAGQQAQAAQDGAWKDFFESMTESGTTFTDDGSGRLSAHVSRCVELTKTGAIGITPANDPDLFHQFKDFHCTVDVFFSTPDGVIDTNMDGNPEHDMAEFRVTVSWTEHEKERSIALWTMVTKRQYNHLQ